MEMESAEARLVHAIRQALEDDAWRGLQRDALQKRSGLDAAELQRLAPTPLAALKLVLKHIDDAVFRDGPADSEDAPRDRLFEIMMRRYEALVPWRKALQRLSRSLPPPDPFAAIGFTLAIERSMAAMLDAAGISSRGLAGAARVRGLCLLHADVLRAFLDDETVDLAATMKALDRRLKDIEPLARLLDRFDSLPRSAAKEMGTPMLADKAAGATQYPE